MSAGASPSQALCRVAIDALWLEFMIDGEADYFVLAYGRVTQSHHASLKPGQSFEIRVGGYDALVGGLQVPPSGAGATAIHETEQVMAIKALAEEAGETGAQLHADIRPVGPADGRADGRVSSWRACEARFGVDEGSRSPDDPSASADLEFSADLRAQLAPDDARLAADDGAAVRVALHGAVISTSKAPFDTLEAFTLLLDRSARAGRMDVRGAVAELTWPVLASDEPHVLAMLELAQRHGALLIDVDTGAAALEEAGMRWAVTDVSLLARVL